MTRSEKLDIINIAKDNYKHTTNNIIQAVGNAIHFVTYTEYSVIYVSNNRVVFETEELIVSATIDCSVVEVFDDKVEAFDILNL